MRKIVGEGNRVNYGVFDEEVEWNAADFELRDFFDRPVAGLRRRMAYHKFNFMGLNCGGLAVGFALVDLGFAYDVFAYAYRRGGGLLFSFDAKLPLWDRRVAFPDDPDRHLIRAEGKGFSLMIRKEAGRLDVDAAFGRRLELSASFPYSLAGNAPLRVLNPSVPTRWTFTEKCSPLVPDRFSLRLDGKAEDAAPGTVAAVYDWTGGFLRRETNWYWASAAGFLPDGTPVGLNLAALVNESFYPEDAFWIGGKRTRVSRAIFDFDPDSPYGEWRVFDEAGSIDLRFRPEGERSDRLSLMPLSKYVFRQFIGDFSGKLRPEGGGEIAFGSLPGFCETHRAVW